MDKMYAYFLGYKKAGILCILGAILSTAAYLNWQQLEGLFLYDDRILWENIWKLIIGICFMPAIMIAWLTYAYRNLNLVTIPKQTEQEVTEKKLKDYIPIAFISITLYILLAMLMYCSWLQGDEVGFAWHAGKAEISKRIVAAFGTYLSTVSRSGDFIMQLFPLPSNRWPCFIITPVAVVLIPFFTGYLMGKKNSWWTTRSGIAFYIFAFFLILLSVHVEDNWRNYRCHAAVMNYLWPSCATLLFLAFFNPANWKSSPQNKYLKAARYTGAFLLGFYCAWGTESGTVALIFILSSFYLWHLLKHKRIPAICNIGTAGAMWGALLLLSSPSFKIRSIFAGETFGKWHLLSREEIITVVHNLSWDKICEFNGGDPNAIIILKSIPIFERIHFLPYLAERYWQCCQIPAVIAAILLVVILLGHTNTKRMRVFFTSVVLIIIAFVTAVSFLAGCIPSHMSFLPAAYVVAVFACYLFLQLPDKKMTQSIIAACMALGALIFFIPLGIEAWQIKKCEHAYIAEIQQQKAEGKKDLIVNYSVPQGAQAPRNTLKLIPSLPYLNYSSKGFARIYNVDSIRFVTDKLKAPSTSEK